MADKRRICRICKGRDILNDRRSRLCPPCAEKNAFHKRRKEKERMRREAARPGLIDRYGDQCMICDAIPHSRAMNVDHNHKTGQIRGLLCYRCNYGLHWYRDNPALLRAAADYLDKFPPDASQAEEPEHEPWCLSLKRPDLYCDCWLSE